MNTFLIFKKIGSELYKKVPLDPSGLDIVGNVPPKRIDQPNFTLDCALSCSIRNPFCIYLIFWQFGVNFPISISNVRSITL